MNLLERLVHVNNMSVDDTNILLTVREKMESLIIQQIIQTYISDFFPKN